MGTVYAIANQKGGVGKTTTAVNVAACIAEAGRTTLLIDVDPQANATVGLGISRSQVPGLYEVLTGDASAEQALTDTVITGLKVLPAGPGLAGANVELPRMEGFEQRLRERLEPIREMFEYILLDCPPSLGPLTVSALVAADRVIVPVQTEYFALEGLAGLLETLALVQRELNPRLTVAGMLISMHGHLDQDIPLPVASWACPGGQCWFLRASDAREDHGQNDLVVLNRELAAAILARGLPAPAPSLWEPRHPGVTGSGLKALGRQAFLGGAEQRKLCIQNHDGFGRRLGQWIDGGYHRWSRLGLSLSLQTGSPVARPSFAAAGAHPPQLVGGLIKEDVGAVGHGFPLHDHSSRGWARNASRMRRFVRSIFCVFSKTWGPLRE